MGSAEPTKQRPYLYIHLATQSVAVDCQPIGIAGRTDLDLAACLAVSKCKKLSNKIPKASVNRIVPFDHKINQNKQVNKAFTKCRKDC